MTDVTTAGFNRQDQRRGHFWNRDDAKRMADLLLTSVGLLLISPLLLAAAVAIRLDSPGPVLFVQERVGLRGRRFRIYKFRSMYIDAENRRDVLLNGSDRGGVCFKMKEDPRVTTVGRFIRRFSIDELPQLFNVLKGDMSLVGPRPALPEEVAAYAPRAMRRLDALPGVTGVWQVSGRADVSFDKMVEMDISYIRRRSLFVDLLIIAKTAGAVVSARGAY